MLAIDSFFHIASWYHGQLGIRDRGNFHDKHTKIAKGGKHNPMKHIAHTYTKHKMRIRRKTNYQSI